MGTAREIIPQAMTRKNNIQVPTYRKNKGSTGYVEFAQTMSGKIVGICS